MRNLKKVLALVLAMAMSLSLAVTAGAANLSDYSDSDKVTDKYATAVDFASQLGILEGFDDGKYHPQGTLTRAQLATMVYRMTTADVADVYTANFAGGAAEAFSDTAATAWYAGYVGYAADAELLKGLGDGTYAPNDALTGYAALAAFLRGVGYDEPGHNFVGADWTVEVAKVAKQAGVLEGISNVDLNKPITREVAAQMIYNIMFSDMVAYTPAFGYQPDISFDLKDQWFDLDAKTLAYSEFDIVTEKEGFDANIAPWGRPATEWYTTDSENNVAVSIAAEPVATYTVAVDECDMAKDLGLKKDGVVAQDKVFVNGAKVSSRSVVFGSDKAITLDAAKDVTVGAQGTLTEIYLVDGKYQSVQIETWLAKATATAKAVVDKAGHETSPATATFDIYGGSPATATIETADFAKGDYALVNFSKWNDGDEYKGATYYLTATAPAASGDITAYSLTNKTSTIGGTVYDWAAKFNLGWADRLDVDGKTYDVFEDFYGNVIGLIPSEIVYTYGIVTKMDWSDSYLPLADAAAYANLLDFSANPSAEVVLDSYLTKAFSGVGTSVKGVPADASVSTTASFNSDYYNIAYKFETLSDGSVAIAEVGAKAHINSIDTGVTDTLNNKSTNDFTVYLVMTGNETDGYTYKSYTGFQTVPSMKDVDVTYFADGDYITYMFVDATKATFTGSTFDAYIGNGEFDEKNGDLYGYEMFVDGKETVKYSKAANLGNGYVGTGLYEVTVDAAGNILSVQALSVKGEVMTISGVTSCDGTVITNGPTAISHEGAPIYEIDATNSVIADKEVTYADAVGHTCFVIVNADNEAVAIYIYN